MANCKCGEITDFEKKMHIMERQSRILQEFMRSEYAHNEKALQKLPEENKKLIIFAEQNSLFSHYDKYIKIKKECYCSLQREIDKKTGEINLVLNELRREDKEFHDEEERVRMLEENSIKRSIS